MLVKGWMHKPVITVDNDDSLIDAMDVLQKHKISRAPVMSEGKLVGMVTMNDLKRAIDCQTASLVDPQTIHFVSKIKIKHILVTKKTITVPFDFTVSEAAEILIQNKISGVPVVDHDGKIIGIITETDIFKLLTSLTCSKDRGIDFSIMVEDKTGAIKGIEETIRKHGGRIISILSSYHKVLKGYRMVYLRMYDLDRNMLDAIKKELNEKTTLFYMIDYNKKIREIYKTIL